MVRAHRPNTSLQNEVAERISFLGGPRVITVPNTVLYSAIQL